MFRALRMAIGGIALLLAVATAADAARPIVDLHTLDAYFALFAQDSNVPWKSTSVRLDTYSSAPVEFAAYAADPGDVLVAGSGARPRALDTRRLRPVARWRFTPPGGYQFQTSAIAVPLGSREGFFVVEARRGRVAEQVWIDRTRLGLIAKGSPAELTLYAADLGTGRALAHARVQLLTGGRLVTRLTDAHGLIRWSAGAGPRPIFALAQWGASYAFVSPLPQAPLPAGIVAVRTDSAVVHAGDALRVAGFARVRRAGVMRPAAGVVQLSLRDGPALVAQAPVALDAGGAFSATLAVPANARGGEYAVLAATGAGVGGTTVHVDANPGGLTLSVEAACGAACIGDADVPLVVRALRAGAPAGGIPLRVTVVRSPHAGGDETKPWGLTSWLDETVATDGDGRATIAIPRPTDGLASTFGITVRSGEATAQTRVVVPTAAIALHVVPERDAIALGAPANFTVSGSDARTGAPAAGLAVTVELRHGGGVQQQRLVLDADGRARGAFASAPLGASLIVAAASANGAVATDAAQVEVSLLSDSATLDDSSAHVRVAADRAAYRPGDDLHASLADPGAAGDALVSLETALGTAFAIAPVGGGAAQGTFRLSDAPGAIRLGAAFVRDGALEWNAVPVGLEAPGRAIRAALAIPAQPLRAGATAQIGFSAGAGTLVIRLTRGAPSGGAAFEDAPALLDVSVASTQSTAPADPTWHQWVDASGDRPSVLGFARRSPPPDDVRLVQAETRALLWSVRRAEGASFALLVPSEPGNYVLSVLFAGDDGRVAAAASNIEVR